MPAQRPDTPSTTCRMPSISWSASPVVVVLPWQSGSGKNLGKIALGIQPGLAVTRAFLRQQHIQHLTGPVAGVQHEAHQSTRVWRHGGLAQLQGVHLAQALESLHVDFAALLFRLDTR